MPQNKDLFFKVLPDNIYVKCPENLMPSLFEVFSENNKILKKVEGVDWTFNLDTGNSYEVETKKEVEEFKDNNLKYRKLHET